MDAIQTVARNVRKLRIKKQLSQEALADNSDTGREYVSALERGLRNPTVRVLERLAGALDVTIGDLFALVRSNEQSPSGLKAGRKRS